VRGERYGQVAERARAVQARLERRADQVPGSRHGPAEDQDLRGEDRQVRPQGRAEVAEGRVQYGRGRRVSGPGPAGDLGRALEGQARTPRVIGVDRPGRDDLFQGPPFDPQQVDHPVGRYAGARALDRPARQERRADPGAEGEENTAVIARRGTEQPLTPRERLGVVQERHRSGRARQAGHEHLPYVRPVEGLELADPGVQRHPARIVERAGQGDAPALAGSGWQASAARQYLAENLIRGAGGIEVFPPGAARHQHARRQVDHRGRDVRAADLNGRPPERHTVQCSTAAGGSAG